MANLQHIVYLSSAEYATLLANGTLTKNNRTITYNANDLYITPDNGALPHKLTFGSSGQYIFDGSADVTVPEYTGVVV